MKNIALVASLAGIWTAIALVPVRADTLAPPSITHIVVSNNQVLLIWTNGRPTYQVQTRSGDGQNWTNVGGATSGYSAVVPIAGTRAFYRVVSDYTAQYQLTLDIFWNQATQPVDWPADPHMTALAGGTHNGSVHFYREGELAGEGTRLVAELGQRTQIFAEIGAAITNGTADFLLSGPGVRPIPGSVNYQFPQAMKRDYPLVTLLSMVGPSPDWFVGVDSLSLMAEGAWVQNKTVTLYALDSGTDGGTTYASPDAPMPHVPIAQITGFPALVNGVVMPWGSFTFTRLD